MELKFSKVKESWVAEFEATADFNLHIEGLPEGRVSIYQRGTNSGEYAYVKSATPYPSLGKTYDYDFSALVYPKFIKVVCESEPTFGEVVSDGEVTDLNFQTKVVEVAQNGTIEVTPDHGFAAMNAVEVKVNVPQSGGSASDNKIEYLDMRGISNIDVASAIAMQSISAKVKSDKLQVYMVGSSASVITLLAYDNNAIVEAVEFDFFGETASLSEDGQVERLRRAEVFNASGVDVSSLPRITREEFYTL